MWTSASTKGRSFLWLTLHPNGSSPFFNLLLFCWVLNNLGQNSFNSIFKSGFVDFGMNSGFTDTNYTQLTELYNRYKDKGLFLCINRLIHPIFVYLWMDLLLSIFVSRYM